MNGAPGTCPCCGQAIPWQMPVVWSYAERALIGNGHVVRFQRHEAELIDALWPTLTGPPIFGRERLVTRAFARRIDGGPESLSWVSVVLHRVRGRLRQVGLEIPRIIPGPAQPDMSRGYRLRRIA